MENVKDIISTIFDGRIEEIVGIVNSDLWGKMMDNKRQVRLSEIAELITKGTTPTTLGYDFQETGVNFLKIECFNAKLIIDT